MIALGESKGSPSYPEGVIAYGESERTDELRLVTFAYPEGVRRRSPQRGKEDREAEANKSTPLPLYPFGVRGDRLWKP